MKVRKYKTIDGLKNALEKLPEAKLTYTRSYYILYNKSDNLKFIRYFCVRLASEHPEYKYRQKGYCSPIGIRVSPDVYNLLNANQKLISDIAQYIK